MGILTPTASMTTGHINNGGGNNNQPKHSTTKTGLTGLGQEGIMRMEILAGLDPKLKRADRLQEISPKYPALFGYLQSFTTLPSESPPPPHRT